MKQKMVPIISIVVGLLAFWLTRAYISSRENDLKRHMEEITRKNSVVKVIGAAEDLPKGAKIDEKDLAIVNIDRRNASKAVPLDQRNALIGRKLLMKVSRAEPIFWMEIEGADASGGLSLASLIQNKLRAISIPVAGSSAVSGMIQPGDYVDILGTFTLPSKKTPGESEIATLTLLQNVTVLATGQRLAKTAEQKGAAASSYSSITVEVTPREAELLVFAQQVQGRLTMTLRNPSDNYDERDLPEVNFEHIEKKLPEYNNIRQKDIRRTR